MGRKVLDTGELLLGVRARKAVMEEKPLERIRSRKSSFALSVPHREEL